MSSTETLIIAVAALAVAGVLAGIAISAIRAREEERPSKLGLRLQAASMGVFALAAAAWILQALLGRGSPWFAYIAAAVMFAAALVLLTIAARIRTER